MLSMDALYVRVLGAIVFYAIMYYGYRYASGKYTQAKNHAKYLAWVGKHGSTVKRSIRTITIMYTLGQLLILFYGA